MTPQHDSKRLLRAAILRGALVACLAQSGLAGRAFLCADVPQDLFDGTSLAGWSLVHDAQFSVKDGKLCLDGGNGWLRTNQRFRDFALTFEWRALGPSYDSGLFFRAGLDGKPWPPGYQVNLRHDEVGNLVGVKGAGGPTPASVKPQGEWNRFDLRVEGKRAALQINGVDAWKTEALEERDGFIGIQAEVHRFEFRGFHVVELGYTDLAEGWNGTTGKHLAPHGAGTWELRKDGVLANSGEAGGWIGTKTADWADFSVKLDFRLPRDANSGLFIRSPAEGNPTYDGIEVQLVDDDTTRWQLRPEQHSGALYGAIAPSRRATRPAGTWESLEVTAKGSRVEVRMNGLLVVDADLAEAVKKISEASALRDRPRKGHLGLQSSPTGAEFRSLRARRLDG
jgi:hypothetical protein